MFPTSSALNKISNECRREPDIIAIDEAADLAGEKIYI